MIDSTDAGTALLAAYAVTVERLLRGDDNVEFPVEAAGDAPRLGRALRRWHSNGERAPGNSRSWTASPHA